MCMHIYILYCDLADVIESLGLGISVYAYSVHV